MPKVFGLHEIELRPEADPAEYERYFAEQVAMQPAFQGWTAKLLRADRGPRAGKFLVLYEIDSVEARDRYFPNEGQPSEEFTSFLDEHPEVAADWEKSSALEAAEAAAEFEHLAERRRLKLLGGIVH
jgi:hypothetical protein